jgi:hypothetical protein
MEDLIGKSGNGVSTIGCLRPGCGNKVDIQHDEHKALICNDVKCKTYLSCISSNVLDVDTIALEYYHDIMKFNILGGRKNKDAKAELLSKRDFLRVQILYGYKKTLADNYVQRQKRSREACEDISLFESECKKIHTETPAEENEGEGEGQDEANENESEKLIEFDEDVEYGEEAETTDADQKYLDEIEGMVVENA